MKQFVKVINLGRMGYGNALRVQHNHAAQLLEKLREQHVPHTVLLVEHPPVYTVGRRQGNYTKEDEERLRALGADYQITDRGGLITFHGPGQLVAYPILNLKHFNMGMRQYICGLQKTVIGTCADFGLVGKTTEHTGVWVNDKKICAMGVHGRRHITTHGIGLNVNTDLTWFDHIVPCGIEGKDVTSIAKETGKDHTVDEVVPVLLKNFCLQFNGNVSEVEMHQEQ